MPAGYGGCTAKRFERESAQHKLRRFLYEENRSLGQWSKRSLLAIM